MRHLLRWLKDLWEQSRREAHIPAPPFRASKRTGTIMYGVWYGRLTPQQARDQAAAWGFPADAIDEMLNRALQPPSYWSRQDPGSMAGD